MTTDKMIHRELSESIIGAAMRVLNTLKPGLNEKAYENDLVIKLKKNGLQCNNSAGLRYFTRATWSTHSFRTSSWMLP